MIGDKTRLRALCMCEEIDIKKRWHGDTVFYRPKGATEDILQGPFKVLLSEGQIYLENLSKVPFRATTAFQEAVTFYRIVSDRTL